MTIERWWYSLRVRIRALLRRRAVEQELADELRDHIESQTAANVAAGMTAAEARRAALVAFGGVERIKDESRDVHRLTILDHLAQLRVAARSLRRARTFSVASIATIALAVAAGSVAFTVVNAVLLRPLPYPDSDRLVGLWHAFPGLGMAHVEQAPGTYLTYRDDAQSFTSMGAYGDGMVTVEYADPTLAPERAHVSWITASLLPTLRVRPLIGRGFTEVDERAGAPHVALVSEEFWRTRLHHDPRVIGRTLRLDGTSTEIVGVLPTSFAFPASDVRLWVPFTMPTGPYLGNFNFRAIARLRPGVSIAHAQHELQLLLARTPERFPLQRPGVSTATALAATRAIAVVHSMRDDAVGGFGRILWLIAATVALLVLVAFSNLASLVLARSESRQRELAVRATLGASRARLWWSLFAESAIIAVGGGIIGTALAVAALGWLSHIGPTVLPDPMTAGSGRLTVPRLDEIHPDALFASVAIALTMAFGVVAAAIGMWRMARADAASLLHAAGGRGGTASRESQQMRAAFVAAEVALSLVLLSGSAVLARSLLRMRAVRPGFDPAGVLTLWTSAPPTTLRTSADVSRFYREALDAVRRVPGVATTGIVSTLPLATGWRAVVPAVIEDAHHAEGALPPAVPELSASRDYFRAMGIPILAGRSFDDLAVQRGVNEVVIGRALATRYWNDSTGQRALGRRLRPRPDAPWYTIVGVVGDVRDTALTAPPTSAIYLPADAGPDSTAAWPRGIADMAFVIRTRGAVPQLASAVTRAIRSVNAGVAIYDVATMEARVSEASSRTNVALLLLAAGALATLVLGVVGLYGVIAYLVSLRAREIGIRIALGLAPDRAARGILVQGERIAAVGAVAGQLVFLAFARLLRSLAYGVSTTDGAALVAAAALVLAVTTIATWLPARRAARIDPAEALRSE